MTALGLTDHGAMYGVVPFAAACKKEGITPILGVEAYLARRSLHDRDGKLDQKSYHQLLLAETEEGYRNLLELTTLAHLEGYYYKPRIDLDALKKYNHGLIATSSCLAGIVPRTLEDDEAGAEQKLLELAELFAPTHGMARFYLELQPTRGQEEQERYNQWLRDMAKKHALPLVATNDIHYLTPEDADVQDVLVCVNSGKQVSDPNRLDMRQYDLSMKSPAEMAELLPDDAEALANTVAIAERCGQWSLKMDEVALPIFPLPDEERAKGTTDRSYLRKLCAEGVQERYGFPYVQRNHWAEGELLPSPPNDPAIPLEERVAVRLEYELSVIEQMGFESYFLIVSDFIQWSRAQGIVVGPGRGSAAGSIVAYLLTVTDVDPLYHNLIFERFLNPERISMPDVDTDFEDTRRDEVIRYVRQRYGEDRVAQIITFGTMGGRAAVRDVGRAMGISYGEVDQLAKLIPSGPKAVPLAQALEEVQELRELYLANDELRQVLDIAVKLEGCARHTSIHAAGVVIGREPLTHYTALQHSSRDDNQVVTQYSMNDVEKVGLVKMDFLGLSNLSIITQALRVIRKTRGVEIDIRNLPLDNVKAYELLARAETTGVFQLESAGMKRYLKELRPTNFEDIVAMVALYRPGPMDAIPDFIASKHGRKAVTYLHPILEPILKDSYGVIVTQDQVLEVARKFAGFSYGQADVLRKAVGKKIKALLDEQRDKFIAGAVNDVGIDQTTAQKVWDFVEPFARYGFNRAHAVCYGMIAYQTAYLKALYPVEFMAALLTSDSGNLDRIGIEVAECRQMHVEVLPPDVNESFLEFGTQFYERTGRTIPEDCPHDAYIRYGLGAIKNVGVAAAQHVVEERQQNGSYKDLTDFLERNAGVLNRKLLEALGMSGALASLAKQEDVLTNLDYLATFVGQANKAKNSTQMGLFAEEAGESLGLTLVPGRPIEQKQRLAWERELLGIYLTDHPIAPHLHLLPDTRTPIVELASLANKDAIELCGVVMAVRVITTKKGDSMAFVQLEDETGGAEVVVFPKVWKDLAAKCVEGTALCLTGTVSRKPSRENPDIEQVALLVDTGDDLANRASSSTARGKLSQVTVRLPDTADRALLESLKGLFSEHEGNLRVVLEVPGVDGHQPMPITQRVALTPELKSRLLGLVGPEAVRVK